MNKELAVDNLELIVAKPSTWSLRAWLVLKLAEIKFKTTAVSPQTLAEKTKMKEYSATGLVPVLNFAQFSLHDSLAISETIHELQPEANLWPKDPQQRAYARSLTAEIHSGFVEIRTQLPFFLGEIVSNQSSSATRELNRLSVIWADARKPYYFAQAGIVDAYYAVMAARLSAYNIQLDDRAGEYQQALLQWPLLQEGLRAMESWEE